MNSLFFSSFSYLLFLKYQLNHLFSFVLALFITLQKWDVLYFLMLVLEFHTVYGNYKLVSCSLGAFNFCTLLSSNWGDVALLWREHTICLVKRRIGNIMARLSWSMVRGWLICKVKEAFGNAPVMCILVLRIPSLGIFQVVLIVWYSNSGLSYTVWSILWGYYPKLPCSIPPIRKRKHSMESRSKD